MIRIDRQTILEHPASAAVKKLIVSLPCLLVLSAILSAILPEIWFPGVRLFGLIPFLLTLGAWFLLGPRKALFLAAVPAAAGLCALNLHWTFRGNDSLNSLIHSRMNTAVEAEIRVCDPSLYADRPQNETYRRILARVTAVRFSPADHWTPADSPVIAVFPPETADPVYGGQYRVKGVLQRPEPPLLEGGFDYGDYLNRRGIHFVLLIGEMEKNGFLPSFTGCLLMLRNRLLNSLTAGMKAPEKALAAGMLFGCRQDISRDSRLAFIQSGTVHLLTVSGLHIGMFAGAVFLLLLPLPFRLRMLLTPFLTLLYAMSTGMQMPAVRALLMLFCWCLPRAMLLRCSGLNAVLLACSLLLLWNPYQLRDAGFQYSFLCVISLLATASETSSWLQLTAEKRHWIPEKKQSRFKQRLIRLLIACASAAAGCLTAWLCSFVLTVFYQGLAVPFAMPANLLTLPAVYLIFYIFSIAALPCLLFPGLGKVFACLMTPLLELIGSICRFFAGQADGRVTLPPLWSILCGITALWLLFCFSKRKRAIAGLGILAGLLFFWCSDLFHPLEPELLVLHGGKQKIPALVLSDPENGFSFAANLADYRSAVCAADFLQGRGHAEATLLICSGTGREFTYGAQYLSRRIKVKHYLAKAFSRRAKTAAAASLRAEECGARIHLQPGNRLRWASGAKKIETFSENGVFSFDISRNGHKLHIRLTAVPEGGTKLRLAGRDLFLPNERMPRAVRIGLNEETGELKIR